MMASRSLTRYLPRGTGAGGGLTFARVLACVPASRTRCVTSHCSELTNTVWTRHRGTNGQASGADERGGRLVRQRTSVCGCSPTSHCTLPLWWHGTAGPCGRDGDPGGGGGIRTRCTLRGRRWGRVAFAAFSWQGPGHCLSRRHERSQRLAGRPWQAALPSSWFVSLASFLLSQRAFCKIRTVSHCHPLFFGVDQLLSVRA